MRRWSRRRQLETWKMAALIALAVAVAIFGRDRWHPRGDQNAPFPAEISGSARPVDGDSLWVGGHEVRLKGIDAPEGRQTCWRNGMSWKCGDAARDALGQMIGGRSVTCSVSERDQYGRLLAVCRAGDQALNSAMVAAGMAVACGAFGREEASAKAARRGIWDSEFQMPHQWRSDNRDR